MSTASVFVDTYAGTLKEAGDLVQPIARGTMTRNDLRAELVELLRGDHPGRQDANEITVFKSVGTALADLAAAQWVYDQQRGA
jgi:ornithine cyclodeaminase